MCQDRGRTQFFMITAANVVKEMKYYADNPRNRTFNLFRARQLPDIGSECAVDAVNVIQDLIASGFVE